MCIHPGGLSVREGLSPAGAVAKSVASQAETKATEVEIFIIQKKGSAGSRSGGLKRL